VADIDAAAAATGDAATVAAAAAAAVTRAGSIEPSPAQISAAAGLPPEPSVADLAAFASAAGLPVGTVTTIVATRLGSSALGSTAADRPVGLQQHSEPAAAPDGVAADRPRVAITAIAVLDEPAAEPAEVEDRSHPGGGGGGGGVIPGVGGEPQQLAVAIPHMTTAVAAGAAAQGISGRKLQPAAGADEEALHHAAAAAAAGVGCRLV